MKRTRAKIAQAAFLSIGIISYLSKSVAAVMTSVGASGSPLLPSRQADVDSILNDRSRLRLAESAEPPMGKPWTASSRGVLPVAGAPPTGDIIAQLAWEQVIAHTGLGSQLILSQAVTSLHITEPPSPVTTPAYQKLSHQETTKALNTIATLTPIQRMSIRDYIGESKNEVSELNINGKEVLTLYDPVTHAYRGEAVVSLNPDGTASVTKVTGGELDFSHSFEIPALNGLMGEDKKATEGENGFNSAKKGWGKLEDNERTTDEHTIPAIKVEGSASYGEVTESTVTFERDGAGKEFGYRTAIAGGSAGASAGVTQSENGETYTGVKGGISGQGPKVAGFVNVFTAPQADEKGEFTRTDYGASVDLHGSLIDLSGKLGCSSVKGCGVGFSIGGLGIASSASLNYQKKKIEVEPFEGNPKEGIGSTPAEVTEDDADDGDPVPADLPSPKPSASQADEQTATAGAAEGDEADTIEAGEQAAYETAVKDNSVGALNNFLEKYPNSPYADTVRERESDLQNPGQESAGQSDEPDATSPDAKGAGGTAAPEQGSDEQGVDTNAQPDPTQSPAEPAPADQGEQGNAEPDATQPSDETGPAEQSGDQGNAEPDQSTPPDDQPTPAQEHGPY